MAALFFTLCACLPVIPFLLPYLPLQQSGMSKIPIEQVAFWAADPTNFLTPNPRHFLFGEWVQKHLTLYEGQMPYEFIIGWGIIPSLFALYGWNKTEKPARRGWGWWIAAAVVLSMGPYLKLFGRVILFPVEVFPLKEISNILNWIGQHSLAQENFTLGSNGAIPLPGLFVRWFVPGMIGMRSWGRFAYFATLGIAALAGSGLDRFIQIDLKTYQKKFALSGALITLVFASLFFEYYSGFQQLILPAARPVDYWLAQLPETVNIVQMPIETALSGPQMYYTMHHRQRIASGYGTYFPILFEQRYPELDEFPSDSSIDILAHWGEESALPFCEIRYVLVDEKDVPADQPLWEAIQQQKRLIPVKKSGTIHVYQIR